MTAFAKGDLVRVVSYPAREWVGNTGIVVRTPGEEATPGAGPSGMYAMTFDGREGVFAPFRADQLEAVLTETQTKIVKGATSGRFTSLQSCADIAHKAGVAESTVRRHLDALIRAGYLKHTSYSGLYAPGQSA